MPATTTSERHRTVREQLLAQDEHAESGGAEGEGGGVGLAEVREEVPHPLPEVAVRALEPEELRELRAGQVQGDPGLEAGHDRLGDEAHEAPAPKSQAAKAIAATMRAVAEASAAKRDGSPPAMSPSEVPTSSEIAEVTVTAVCRELQKSQNTSPANRQE